MRNKTTKINRINLLVLLCAIFLSFNFVSAVNINPSTGGGSTVQIVNISSVSAGDSSIEVTGGSSITVNQTWLTAFIEIIVEGYNYITGADVPNYETDSKAYNGTLAYNSSLANYYPASNPLNFINTTTPYNDTWINNTFYNKTQSDSRYLQSYTESDPLWTGNSTLVAYKAQNNNFSVNQNFQGNITLGSITIAQDGCTYYGLSRICGVA